jgi:hypothetical protein
MLKSQLFLNFQNKNKSKKTQIWWSQTADKRLTKTETHKVCLIFNFFKHFSVGKILGENQPSQWVVGQEEVETIFPQLKEAFESRELQLV